MEYIKSKTVGILLIMVKRMNTVVNLMVCIFILIGKVKTNTASVLDIKVIYIEGQ